jgi:hypothetical protein
LAVKPCTKVKPIIVKTNKIKKNKYLSKSNLPNFKFAQKKFEMRDVGQCITYDCNERLPVYSVCLKGFIVFVPTLQVGSHVDAMIYAKDRIWCLKAKVLCNNYVIIEWSPANFIEEDTFIVSIEILQQGERVLLPYGASCEDECGISIELSKNVACKKDYAVLNCGEFKFKVEYKVNKCEWTMEIYKCKWTIKMANKIDYDGVVHNIPNPTKQENGATIINPDFIDYLDLLEEGAFVVTLVGDKVEIEYTGTYVVEFWSNCGILEKTCL